MSVDEIIAIAKQHKKNQSLSENNSIATNLNQQTPTSISID